MKRVADWRKSSSLLFFVHILLHINKIYHAVKKCVAYQRKSDLCDTCTLFLQVRRIKVK